MGGGGGPIRYIPRPQQRGGLSGIRKAVARLGHFARPFAEGAVKTLLPIGLKKLKKVGSKTIKAGAELLKQVATGSRAGGGEPTSYGEGKTAYFPLINRARGQTTTISTRRDLRKSKTKGGKRRKKRATSTLARRIGAAKKRSGGKKKRAGKKRRKVAGKRKQKSIGGRKKQKSASGGKRRAVGGGKKKSVGGKKKSVGGKKKRAAGRKKQKNASGEKKKSVSGGKNKRAQKKKSKFFSVFD